MTGRMEATRRKTMATKNTKSAVWTEEEVEKAFVDVKKKALIDKTFRQTLLADPRKAIQQVTKKEVPAAYKIKIIESDPAYHMTFVLPQMASADLSDVELEKVAGGFSVDSCDIQTSRGVS
jgi:hypothetical protein